MIDDVSVVHRTHKDWSPRPKGIDPLELLLPGRGSGTFGGLQPG